MKPSRVSVLSMIMIKYPHPHNKKANLIGYILYDNILTCPTKKKFKAVSTTGETSCVRACSAAIIVQLS